MPRTQRPTTLGLLKYEADAAIGRTTCSWPQFCPYLTVRCRNGVFIGTTQYGLGTVASEDIQVAPSIETLFSSFRRFPSLAHEPEKNFEHSNQR